jgi:hypothetical protein
MHPKGIKINLSMTVVYFRPVFNRGLGAQHPNAGQNTQQMSLEKDTDSK